jgi:integrase
MGRKPTRNKNLPQGMRARHRKSGTYFYLDTGETPRREIPLGSDYPLAVQKWAELTISGNPQNNLITFRYVAERYIREELPKKAPATRKDNLRELAKLYEMFDEPPAPLEQIEPINIRQYLDYRKAAPVRANREKALFSHIWNFARNVGLTSKANPCTGIEGNKENGRDTYIDDEVYKAVWEAAEPPLQDALDLAYLTGQRPADVLKLTRADIREGALHLKQAKTGKRLRIQVAGEFATLVKRLSTRKVMSLALVNNAAGYPMTKAMLRGAFDRARIKAIEKNPALADQIRNFQFRDLRAKAGTDKEESHGMNAAQDQLGHSTQQMTQQYVRHRRGKLVEPTR